MGLVRYLLAFAVVVAHFNTVFGTNLYFPISSYDAVGSFFALSGFLLYGSYLKSPNLKKYMEKRARRILPAYFFIVLLCAFLLVSVSALNPKEYFSNPGWWKYLLSNLSFLNFLHPDLPGVFTDSSITAVNGSLWTMKVEIMLYITVPIVVWICDLIYQKFRYKKALVIFSVIYIVSLAYRLVFTILFDITGREIFQILGRQFFGQLMFFYSGVFIYFVYDKFKQNLKFILPISLAFYIAVSFIPYLNIIIGPIIVSCIVIAISSFPGIVSKFNWNNLSYDIYLFHFPIIQVICQYKEYFPLEGPWIFIVVATAVLILSIISWRIIEKPFLSRRFI